jgi:hypothetical protein
MIREERRLSATVTSRDGKEANGRERTARKQSLHFSERAVSSHKSLYRRCTSPSLKSNVARMSLSAQLANIGVAPNEDDKPVRGEWSKRATDALVESWGNKFLQQNRGNLTDLHWKGMLGMLPKLHLFLDLPWTALSCASLSTGLQAVELSGPLAIAA